MKDFGKTKKGEQAYLYELKNKQGMEVHVTDYGANLVDILVSDKNGKLRDVVLGYDDAAGYEEGTASVGAIVGRVANRIAGASFELNGKSYQLQANDGANANHGGKDFYNQRMWKLVKQEGNSVSFQLDSPDGDQNFPGNLQVTVIYSLSEDNELKIHYEAVSDQDTLVNLTNHSYFNLDGEGSGSVLNQEVKIYASTFTIADQFSIPTGEIVAVKGTPMDFTEFKALGKEIDADYEPLILGKGYDHNWVLDGQGFRKAAEAKSEKSGIHMEVYTDRPGLQLYTANFLDGEAGKGGKLYEMRDAVCFETQFFPDAIHKEHFPGPVLKAGEKFDSTTVFKFI